MAKKDRIISSTIIVNGEQAKLAITAVADKVQHLKNTIKGLEDAQGKVSASNQGKYNQLTRELAQQESIYNELINQSKTYSEVLDNISGSSMTQLKRAATILRKEMKNITDNAELDKMRDKLEQVKQQIKRMGAEWVNIDSVMQNLDGTSEKTLRRSVDQLRDLRSETVRGSADWVKYTDQLKIIEGTLNNIGRKNYQDVMGNLGGSSQNEINDAIAQMEKLRSEQVMGSTEWQNYTTQIKTAKEYMAQFAETSKTMSLSSAQTVAASPGNFSIGEIKEAIKVLQQFRETLKPSDTAGVDSDIERLNAALQKVKPALVDVTQVLQNPANFTSKQINQAIDQLNEQLDNMLLNDPARNGVKQQIEELQKVLRTAKSGGVDVNNVLANLKSASLKELRMAAQQLSEQMETLQTNTRDYVTVSKQYAQVKKRIEELNDSYKKHDNAITSVMKRLVAYIGIYGAFNMAKQKIEELVSGNLELSDSLADIQKTTGMTTKEVALLSKEIDGLDTRTAQKDLNDLAFQAGKLGISGVDNVHQFVAAGNQLVVALGEDLGGAEAVKQLMKINDVLGTTKDMGIEKALLATGSAINELGQSSTASEGYMVDFAQRLGGIAAQSKLTMAELIALGGTADTLGQNVEVSATAINKFVVTLQTNTRGVAQAAGVTDEALQKLLDSGKTMDAIVMVLEGLGKKGGIAELAPLMGDLGSDGARLTAVLTSMASNTDKLRESLYTTNTAFAQATSVTNEYNVKNESAAALLARMGNTIKEYFVNSDAVTWLTAFLKNMMELPAWIERNATMVRIMASALVALSAQAAVAIFHFKSLKLIFSTTMWQAAGLQIMGFVSNIRAMIVANGLASVSLGALKTALNAIGTFFKANWLGLLVTAVTTAITYFSVFRKTVNDTAKAIGEYTSELAREQLELNALFSALGRTNTKTEERSSIISQLNQKYGKYLGFMLSETDSAKKLASAHELINAKLRESISLRMRDNMMQNIANKYGSETSDTMSEIYSGLTSTQGIGQSFGQQALSIVTKTITDNVGKEALDVMVAVRKALTNKFGAQIGSDAYFKVNKDIEKYVELQAKIKDETDATVGFIDAEIRSSSEAAVRATQKALNVLNDEFAAGQSVDKASQYVKLANQFIKENPTSKGIEFLKKNVDWYNAYIKKNSTVKPENNPWGSSMELDKASVDQLVTEYKKFFDWRKQVNADKNYSMWGQGGFKSRQEEMDALMQKITAIKGQLNSMGYNEYGKFLKGDGSGSGTRVENAKLKAQRDAIQAELNKVQTIYEAFKEQITAQLNEGMLTEESFNSMMLANDQAYYQDRQDVMTDFLDGRKKILTKAGKDVSKITDEKIRTGLSKDIQKDAAKSEEALKKLNDAWEKLILSANPIEKLREEWKKTLEVQNALGDTSNGISEAQATERIQIIESMYGNIQSLSDEGFRDLLANDKLYGENAAKLTKEQLDALRTLYGTYFDDIRNQSQAAVNKMWSGSVGEKQQSTNQNALSDYDNETNMMSGMGASRTTIADRNVDKNLMNIENEKAAHEARMAMIKEHMDGVAQEMALGQEQTDFEKTMSSSRGELANSMIDSYQAQMDKYGEVATALGEGFGALASAEWNSVEDRKQAGKAALQSVAKLGVQMVGEWLKELAMKKTIDAMKVASNNATNAQMNSSNMGKAATDAGIESSSMAATVTAETVKGQAKEVGSKGILGIGTGLAIAALMAGLMMAANAVINSLFPSAETANTSSKKLTTGMLTYATGNVDRFDVIGDDGQSYNVKPTSKLRTGRYNTPHMAIFAEKEPEMIISGPTTRKLMLQYPEIIQAIQTVDKGERIKTYATGNVSAFNQGQQGAGAGTSPVDIAAIVAAAVGAVMPEIRDVISQNTATNQILYDRINKGIPTYLNPYGRNGAIETLEKANKFVKSKKIKP